MFFAAVNAVGTFFVGDESGVHREFVLATNERIYDYCLLDDHCFMTIETIAEDGSSQKTAELRDLNGVLISKQDDVTYFRLVSDWAHNVLGIDMSYRAYLISLDINEASINVTSLDVQQAPVLFYMIDKDEFLLHFDYSINGSKLGFYRLSAG